MLKLLGKQFVHDLKANWQKSAALGVLLVIGMVFWLPPLVRAVGGSSSAQPAAAATGSEAKMPPIQTETKFNAVPNFSGGTTTSALTWEHATELAETDPLVRSVEVAAIQSDPFRIDPDQFPPPILFAEDTEAQQDQEDKSQTAGLVLPGELTLKSTIIGVKRRAAFINKKLYYEGADIEVNGETYRLKAVFRRKVLLRRNDREFELRIEARLPNRQRRTNGRVSVTDD